MHLGYLSERLVPFALFSDHVPSSEKKKMRSKILKNQRPVKTKIQEMPYSDKFSNKFLYDFIGHDSWTMFQLLGIDSSFVKCSVEEWEESNNYIYGKMVLSNLHVVNDAAERALGLATEKNTRTAPKTDCQQQALFKVVKGICEKLSKFATSTDVVTKKALKSIDYNWN